MCLPTNRVDLPLLTANLLTKKSRNVLQSNEFAGGDGGYRSAPCYGWRVVCDFVATDASTGDKGHSVRRYETFKLLKPVLYDVDPLGESRLQLQRIGVSHDATIRQNIEIARFGHRRGGRND